MKADERPLGNSTTLKSHRLPILLGPHLRRLVPCQIVKGKTAFAQAAIRAPSHPIQGVCLTLAQTAIRRVTGRCGSLPNAFACYLSCCENVCTFQGKLTWQLPQPVRKVISYQRKNRWQDGA